MRDKNGPLKTNISTKTNIYYSTVAEIEKKNEFQLAPLCFYKHFMYESNYYNVPGFINFKYFDTIVHLKKLKWF